MPTVRRAPRVTFVRGQARTCGTKRAALPRFSFWSGRDFARPRPPRGGRGGVRARRNTLLHTSNLFGTQPGQEVAATLDRLIGGGGKVFFANSGAEANECAIKLARKWAGHGRYVVLSAYGSFHGRTLATLHATGQPAKHEAFQPLPGRFRHVAWQDIEAMRKCGHARGGGGTARTGPGRGWRMAGRGGVLPGRAPAVRRAGPAVHGRRGPDRPWPHRPLVGFPALRGPPDVVTVAKALGNGVPIGACWARSTRGLGVRAR